MICVRSLSVTLFLILAACHSGGNGAATPGDGSDTHAYADIAADELLRFTGTEPFWGGQAAGGTLTYTTPDNPDGLTIRVDRFAGRNGVSFSGRLEDKDLVMAVSPGRCGDGMSDRIYPFNVTLRLGDEIRNGCAWSDVHPFEGGAAP
ncbi:MAG: COG3650 family protein [Sphingobium sp.]